MKSSEIREIRKKLNFTQEEFAEALFCSKQCVAFWERNFRVPSDYHMATLKQLQIVLGKDSMTVEGVRSVMKKSKTTYELLRGIF